MWDTPKNRPMEGARDALSAIHEQGHYVTVHSCNNANWIRQMCEEHDLRVDVVWEGRGKPVAAAYIDDRGVTYAGDWPAAIIEAMVFANERPVR